MSENNKSYRLRTKIGVNNNSPIEDRYLTVKLTDKIDSIDVMSLKIKQENAYKFHAADYGVVVGRAIANGGFGVPNVKVSVFIAATEATKNDAIYNAIYPYERVTQKNKDNIRYNLLPDVGNDDCYQVVGTFPNKRLVLDDDNYLEIYDNYYKFTTRTNNAGDYMIFGIPTGGQILHFDADLSDVGVLSQRPRDMIYKGYNINQFENANQFKVDDNLANLPQIISQDDSVYIYPFWGDEDENIIGITRHDIDINYKFEPTCVFIGSIVSDTNSNHISKKCIPTAGMGMMEELITGSGTIEMIRKKQNGDVEQFNIQGTQLINNDGVWCYQIPMNLDYVMTDEYGNLVPSDDPTKGIATRTKVRFRISMQDFENDSVNSFRTKVLVPNNPQNARYEPDYVFGSFTEDESFRDLLWNNVYTVKSFIPRFQKGNGNRNRRFSGIKQCNYHGTNNPIPYNNMRINLSFQFVITCLIVRLLIWIVGVYNAFITALANVLSKFVNSWVVRNVTKMINSIDNWKNGGKTVMGKLIRSTVGTLLQVITFPLRAIKLIGDFFRRMVQSLSCIYLDGSMCEALEGSWFFAPNCSTKKTVESDPNFYVWKNMMAKIDGKKMDQIDYSSSKSKTAGGQEDKQSINNSNADDRTEEENMVTIFNGSGDTSGTSYQYVISRGLTYFVQCVEISLAQEFRVVQFDFYNDWVNGMIYIPRWERSLKKKRKYFLFGKSRVEIRACNDVYKKRFFERKNNLTEQCGVSYKAKTTDNSVGTKVGCKDNKKYKCHKKRGRRQFRIFNEGGAVHSEMTASGLYAYYFKPCEYITNRNAIKNRKVNLFATDLVLLGSLVDCDLNGTPLFTNELTSSSYQLPSPLAHTDSTEEGFTYKGVSSGDFHSDERFNGVFDMSDTLLNPQDDGSVTEESGLDWGYTGPGQGEVKKAKTYTPGGHFLGISCVNAESTIKSCVNLKRVCEVGVWSSQRQEVFNGYDGEHNPHYVDIIPNGVIAKDDISGGNFRKIFSTLNHNNLRTKVNSSGFTVYDFEYMSPENFGGELARYTKGNYNEPNPLSEDALQHYLVNAQTSADTLDEDGNKWGDVRNEHEDELFIKPIRRSLDERDSDYMRFRLGLDVDNNSTIQTKYLGNDDYGYYMPVYNNSFYFYFGLIPGATALDEFHKQFFAECKQTMTTDDLRLNFTLSYSGCSVTNAFDAPVEISIFQTAVTFNAQVDHLRIFSTAVPIKVVVDSKYTHTHKDEISPDQVYIDCTGWVENNRNVFDFELGKHTITVTDAEGRTATKLVEIVQQKVNLCPTIEGIPFAVDDYIIYSTQSLINGTAPGRENMLDGWFAFNWNESNCECNIANRPIFTYKDITCGRGFDDIESTCVYANDSKLTMLFVSRTHIIKFGNSYSNGDILAFEEFYDYTENNIYNGNSGSTGGFHIYAGEEGNYDFYVLYKENNSRKTIPILLQDNIYIGEPDAIDFDVFREPIESEDDSPVTFRNPIIKIWYNHTNDWYTHLYDGELTPTQIWYVKKNMYYVLRDILDPNAQEDDFNEAYPSKRDLVMNLYYPSTVGNVNGFTDGSNTPNTILHVSDNGETLGDNEGAGKIITRYILYTTGRSEDNQVLRTPPFRYGNGQFILPIFYKPYYYKAVIFEGYNALTQNVNNPASFGHVYGRIYNGVVYDDEEAGGQVFGPTVVNDRLRIDSSLGIKQMTSVGYNDFTTNRTGINATTIGYDAINGGNFEVFADTTNKLLITEGSPKYFESEYTPVEYSVETNVIGTPANWVLDFEMNLTAATQYVKFILSFENNEYTQIRWYWDNYKPLTGVNGYNNQLEAVTTYDFDEMHMYYDSYGDVVGGQLSDETAYADIYLPAPRRNGVADEIKSGTILVDSIRPDNFIFSTRERQKGYLISRNFVRDNINIDYSYDPNEMMVEFFMGVPAHVGGWTDGDRTMTKKGRVVDKAWQRTINKWDKDFAVRKLYVKIPYANKTVANTELRNNFGSNIEQVVITLTSGNTSWSYDLINELGYTFSFTNRSLVVELTEQHPDNTNAYEPGTEYTDVFIDKLLEIFKDTSCPKNGVFGNCKVKLVATGFGSAENEHNNVFNDATFIFNASMYSMNHPGEDDGGED